mgnify:CR=1 FL=1
MKSLNLQDAGYGFIEEFCLEELEYYESLDGVKLLSYTVNVPKSEAVSVNDPKVSTQGVALSKLNYFGTYGGRTFYFYYPSTANLDTKNYQQKTQSILQQWVNNSINLYMVFADIRVAAAWTSIQTLMGAPKNYTVRSGAWTDYYFNTNVHTRGIYTLYGSNSYEMVTSQQYAQLYPYIVFHPVDSPKYLGAYTKDYGYQGVAYSPKFRIGDSKLCQEAWQAFNGAVVTPKHDKVNLQNTQYTWK